MKRINIYFLLALAALLTACSQPVTVGSKTPVQDRILGEMFAQQLEKQGIPVERRLGVGDSAESLEAIRKGDIDIYPGYTGTALAEMGAPMTADRVQAHKTVREALSQVGLEFLKPLGFDSSYAVVTREDFAREHDLKTMSELRPLAARLTLGVTKEFAQRPADGLTAWLDRYGLSFDKVNIIDGENRSKLYSELIDDKIDVMVGYSTDPEIKDFGLATLKDDDGFFPDYQVAPVVAQRALDRYPGIREALSELAGRLDDSKMQELARKSVLSGRSIQSIAAEGLADIGLTNGKAIDKQTPLRIAADPTEIGGAPANATLRAVRTAMPGRAVGFLDSDRPLERVTDRKARLALAPAIAQFKLSNNQLSQDSGFETIAVVGSTFLYALARGDGPTRLGDATRIAAGPEGSASYKLARMVAGHRNPAAQVTALKDTSASTAVSALKSGRVDAAVILASQNSRHFEDQLGSGARAVKLIPAADWWRGAIRFKLPFLRPASLSADVYSDRDEPIRTLAMQATLIGPAPSKNSPLGRSGPSTFSDALQPLPDSIVLAINEALGTHPDVGPHLRKAGALKPKIQQERTMLNPSPSHAILMLAIFAYLAFAGWLLIRNQPEQ